MDSRFQPATYYDVKTTEQLKAFTDTLRLRVLAILRKREATNQQIAAELEQPQARTIHHVKMLLDVGLIKQTRTEIKGGNVEKYYRAIALDFFLHTHLPEAYPVRENINRTIIERINSEVMRAQQEYPHELTGVFRRAHRLTAARRSEFYKRLSDLLDEFFPRAPKAPAEGESFRFAGLIYRDTDRFGAEDLEDASGEEEEPQV